MRPILFKDLRIGDEIKYNGKWFTIQKLGPFRTISLGGDLGYIFPRSAEGHRPRGRSDEENLKHLIDEIVDSLT